MDSTGVYDTPNLGSTPGRILILFYKVGSLLKYLIIITNSIFNRYNNSSIFFYKNF